MERLQRLSGLDASFLYLETSTQPLHVCSILELDTSTIPGGYSFERLRNELSVRVAAIPSFREKLSNTFLNLDHPVWIRDEEFDLDRWATFLGPVLDEGGREVPGARLAASRFDAERMAERVLVAYREVLGS